MATLIIEQLHEKTDGTGFPKKLKDNEIHELAQIHIIARDLVGDLIKVNFDESKLNDVLQKNYNKYENTSFSDVMRLSCQIFQLDLMPSARS